VATSGVAICGKGDGHWEMYHPSNFKYWYLSNYSMYILKTSLIAIFIVVFSNFFSCHSKTNPDNAAGDD